ncbi:MAG: methyl-accepting chemotaxis protein [Acidobacteriota bacterium]
MRLRTKLIVSFSLVLGFALAANSFVTIRALRQSLLDHAVSQSKNLVEILQATDHFVVGLPDRVEDVVGSHLLVEALLTAHLVDIAENRARLSAEQIKDRLKQVAARGAVDEFWITDSKGHAYLRNIEEIDFTFPDRPTPSDQAYQFRRLLEGPNRQYVQRTMPREVDGALFKYAGVSGIDKNRIVEVGFRADSVAQLTTGVSRPALLRSIVGKGGLQRVVLADAAGRIKLDVSGKRLSSQGEIRNPALLADIKTVSGGGEPFARFSEDRLYVVQRLAGENANTVLTAFFDARPLNAEIRQSMLISVVSFGAFLCLGVFCAMLLARSVSSRVTRLARVAGTIADGDLVAAQSTLAGIKTRGFEAGRASHDETRRLLAAISSMAGSLNLLVGRVQQSGVEVNDAASRIAVSAAELERTAAEQSASTNEVVSAAQEISASSKELARTVSEVALAASETARLVSSGRQDLATIEKAMQQIDHASSSISAKLSAIQQKAGSIGSVVEVMNKVAEQTGLLSLNAAIEAEKAGEYGRGFSIVAREIRKLAERTGAAAAHIERSVEDMEMTVVTGGREMERFRAQINTSISETFRIRSDFGRILDRVQGLKPRFDEVNEGVQMQSQSAHHIAEAMVELGESARTAAASLHEFTRVTAHLNEVSGRLQKEVSRFKVS